MENCGNVFTGLVYNLAGFSGEMGDVDGDHLHTSGFILKVLFWRSGDVTGTENDGSRGWEKR